MWLSGPNCFVKHSSNVASATLTEGRTILDEPSASALLVHQSGASRMSQQRASVIEATMEPLA